MAEEELVARLRDAVRDTYELGAELGGGGMSRVFRAHETTGGRQVVIKVLPPDLAADISLARFKREINVAGRMQHPHIVPVLGSGDANGLPWFSMPYVDGDSLRERLNVRGALPVPEAIRILRDMASALAHAHRQGVVHRDIKPENVLFWGDRAMIADFGVAKALLKAESSNTSDPGLTTRRVALGTPTYMSPEQASGDPRVGTRADIYAWGVVAYELITGHTPFEGRSLHGQLRAHVHEVPASISTHAPRTPQFLVDIVMQCLAKAPADRPQLAESIVDVLDAGARDHGHAPRAIDSEGAATTTPRGGFISAEITAASTSAVAAAWNESATTDISPSSDHATELVNATSSATGSQTDVVTVSRSNIKAFLLGVAALALVVLVVTLLRL